jgi:hypothetical protein
MDEMTQLLLVYAATAHIFRCMMAAAIESRKRKCHGHAPIGRISYGPIEDRDRSKIDYLNNKILKNDVICVNMFRVTRASFFCFCDLIQEHGLLKNSIHMCVEQQVAMFLHTIGHNVRNRLVGTNFTRSGETISRYFNKVLYAIRELRNDFIRPPSLSTPAKIPRNLRWDPYFKVVALFYVMLFLIVVFLFGLICHYVRKAQLRRACRKNRDTQIMCLHHRVSD